MKLYTKTKRVIKRSFWGAAILILAASSLQADCCPTGARDIPYCYPDIDCSYLYSAISCPPVKWGAGVDLSLLVWQAREDGLAFAVKNNPLLTPSPDLAADVNGRVLELDFRFAPAFKLNLEMQCPNAWNANVRWTRYYSRSKETARASTSSLTTSGLFALWMLPTFDFGSPILFGAAEALWRLHLNTVDLELGADTRLTRYLNLRLHGGLKLISINQLYTVSYSEGVSNDIPFLPSHSALKNNCLGAGPRMGFNSLWRLGAGWSMAADIAGSITLCHFQVHRDDADALFSEIGTPNTLEEAAVRQSVYSFRPNVEALMGINWNCCYGCRSQYELGFQAAYEVQYYWEQNLMLQLVSLPTAFQAFFPRGDLHCHGLTATIRFGF